MHRNDIIEQVSVYAARWEAESATTARLLDFVSSHPECFERRLRIGHVTGSAWVVNRAGTHVLLTHHKKLDRWLQLGGHADGDPDILRVALREVQEESGLEQITPVTEQIFDIDIHPIPARGDEPEHDHYDIRYAIQVTGSEAYVVSDESHALAWIEIARLDSVTHEASMLRMASKWLAGSMSDGIAFLSGERW